MRILVTGGAGFIGSNLVRRLVNAGDDVIVIDDLSTGYRENLLGLPIQIVYGSILDERALDEAAEGVEAIVHLGALGSVPRSVMDPLASHEANATGTLLVLEAARRQGAYVAAASSSSVYGSVEKLPREPDLPTRPMSPYAASKLATEAYVLAYGESYGLQTTAFRLFNVYGPRQSRGHPYAAVIPVFLEAALRSRPLPIHGDGMQSRDFNFVEDVVKVLACSAHKKLASGIPVNLAFGSRVTLLDVVDQLERLLGHPLEREFLPPRRGDVRASEADPSQLQELFPEVKGTEFAEGLRATLSWYQEVNASPQS